MGKSFNITDLNQTSWKNKHFLQTQPSTSFSFDAGIVSCLKKKAKHLKLIMDTPNGILKGVAVTFPIPYV